jgi:hypothetical protein
VIKRDGDEVDYEYVRGWRRSRRRIREILDSAAAGTTGMLPQSLTAQA